jgi:excisionase family DNA binding protein
MSKVPQSIAATDDSAFLTTGEFAQRVHLSTTTVKKLCDEGALAHVVVTGRGDRRIPVSELNRLLAEADGNRLNVTARPVGLPRFDGQVDYAA